jgi:hypothetical protein
MGNPALSMQMKDAVDLDKASHLLRVNKERKIFERHPMPLCRQKDQTKVPHDNYNDRVEQQIVGTDINRHPNGDHRPQ